MSNEIAHSVAKNTTVQLGQQLITWVSSFLLMLFLPRYLGPVSFGRLYLAMTITGIALMLIDYDGRPGVAKRFARAPEDSPRILANSLGFRGVFWIISFSATMAFTFIAHYPPVLRWLVFLFGLEMLWCGGKTVLLGLFLGFESVQFSSIGAIAERVFISVVGIIALLLGANEIVIAIVMIVGSLLNFAILARLARRFVSSLEGVHWKESVTLVKDGFPYLLWGVFASIYYRIDTVMLSMFTPEAVVGWYGASYKFLDVLSFVPSIFSISLLPVLTKLQGNDGKLLERTTQKSLEFIMVSVFPISFCMFGVAPEIIKLFYGLPLYQPSVQNLQIFSIGLPLIYIDMVLGTALLACDKQRQWAATAFFAAILNIGLNYFMIPYFQVHAGNGGIGAAIATDATELFVMICAIYLMPGEILRSAITPLTYKVLGAAMILIVSLVAMTHYNIPWPLRPVVGVTLYFTLLFSMKTFAPAELRFMKEFFSVKGIKNTFVLRRGVNG